MEEIKKQFYFAFRLIYTTFAIMNKYILPAEWHNQEAILLTWPNECTDWRPYLKDITNTYVQLTRAIAVHEHVIISALNPIDVKQILNNELDSELMAHVQIYQSLNDDTWTRDHGFISLIGNENRQLLDFKFNGWGEKYPYEHDNKINAELYHNNAIKGEYILHNSFVLEGGSIESDGNGTIFTTSSCLLAPHRNQPLTKDNIEEFLKLFLYAKRVIWIDHGQLIGDDTDGHIDTIVRVCPNNTLLYVNCNNPKDIHYDDFKALEKQLMTFTNSYDTQPYNLVALPFPDAIYDGKQRLPATYANFLIINGAVIVPTYNQPENDKKAMDIIHSVFPNREIIGIDACTIIRQHGSIHCLTMQIPAI